MELLGAVLVVDVPERFGVFREKLRDIVDLRISVRMRSVPDVVKQSDVIALYFPVRAADGTPFAVGGRQIQRRIRVRIEIPFVLDAFFAVSPAAAQQEKERKRKCQQSVYYLFHNTP